MHVTARRFSRIVYPKDCKKTGSIEIRSWIEGNPNFAEQEKSLEGYC